MVVKHRDRLGLTVFAAGGAANRRPILVPGEVVRIEDTQTADPHTAPPVTRCPWAPPGDPLYLAYHDEEWGVPIRDDRRLFELLVLEGMQAGLSWRTILARRDAYRELFRNFVPEEVASFGPTELDALLGDRRIIRNRAKIAATVTNAQALLRLREDTGDSFSVFLWSFVDHVPVVGHPVTPADVPVETERSHRVSRVLKGTGFRFVGPVIVQSYLEAAGLLMDHLVSCFRYATLADAAQQAGHAAPAASQRSVSPLDPVHTSQGPTPR